MAITISKQPANMTVIEGKVYGELTVQATGATGYQWKKATSASSTAGATNVPGATSATFVLPKDLEAGTAYYFCTLTGGEETKNSNIATITVVEGAPDYITGAYVHQYIEASGPAVQERWNKALALSDITVPNTAAALRTAQIELFMSVL